MIGVFDAGTVVAYMRTAIPALMSVYSPTGILFSPANGLAVASLKITRMPGASFMYTASPVVYASTFSERLGTAEIIGMACSPRCVPPYGPPSLAMLNAIYAHHSMSQLAWPLYLYTAGGGVCGYLVGCGIGASPELPRVISFNIMLKVL